MFNQAKEEFNKEIYDFARKSLIRKLQKQGVDHEQLDTDEFEGLIADEMEILKSDTKKVGTGIGIGIAISLLTGI